MRKLEGDNDRGRQFEIERRLVIASLIALDVRMEKDDDVTRANVIDFAQP